MDSSEVGRFGTIRLMKRLEPDKVVASYPIDEEEITLGRDPERNIRLYYETVSGLHCKIIFRERKVSSSNIVSSVERSCSPSSPGVFGSIGCKWCGD